MLSNNPSEKASLLFEECIEITDPEKQRDYLNDAFEDLKEKIN